MKSLTQYSVNSVSENKYNFDVIVIGAGHAGCEAGLIAARMGMKTKWALI